MANANTQPTHGKATNPGQRGNNEDSLDLFTVAGSDGTVLRVWLVADGMGGEKGGEVASQEAVKVIGEHLRADGVRNPQRTLQHALVLANQRIWEKAETIPGLRGMGTTVAVAVLRGSELFVASVGDSRIYLIRNGECQRLTVDHTWAQEAVESGRYTEEEIKLHPNRHLLKRDLGTRRDIVIDEKILPAAPIVLNAGDVCALCTDGITEELSDAEIAAVAGDYEPQAAADSLVQKALEHGKPSGKTDNLTAIVIRVPGGAKPKRLLPHHMRYAMLAAGVAILVTVLALSAFMLRSSQEVPIAAAQTATTTETSVGLATRPPPATSKPVSTVGTQMPTAGAFSTLAPTPTRRPEPTREPTSAPLPRTPAQAATPSVSLRPTSTPSLVRYAGIQLGDPPDNGFSDGEEILFEWNPPSALVAGDRFVLQVVRPGETNWTDVLDCAARGDTLVQRQCAMNPGRNGGNGTYRWRVVVKDVAGVVVSGSGEERTCRWCRLVVVTKTTKVCTREDEVTGTCVEWGWETEEQETYPNCPGQ